jgi:hypothetical protein
MTLRGSMMRGVNRLARVYDLSSDRGERKNIATTQSARVAAMAARLAEIRRAARTRP